MTRIGILEFAFALSIVGALTLIIINLLRLSGIVDIIIPFYQLIPRERFPLIGGVGGDVFINIICGIVALIGSRKIQNPVWAIILVIVGIVTGGIGGTLILIGGILSFADDIA